MRHQMSIINQSLSDASFQDPHRVVTLLHLLTKSEISSEVSTFPIMGLSVVHVVDLQFPTMITVDHRR